MSASTVTPSAKTNKDDIRKESKSKKLIKFASVFLLLGFVCVLLSILVETVHLYQTDNIFLLWLNHFLASFLSHIGIGLIILAIVTFLLEIPHWMEYFEERLKKIVINKSYLEHLDRDDLLELQSTIMNVYFRNDSIGKSGGFFKYYQTNIQAIIGLPFRENVTLFLNVSVCETNKSLLKITETLSYQCRQNAGRIQDEISYLPEVNEHIETTDFNVSIQHHSLDTEDGSTLLEYNYQKLSDSNALMSDRNGFKLSIKDHNIDGLNVVIKATYHCHKNRFFNWVLSYPTHGLTLNVSYPKEFSFVRELFFNNERNYNEQFDEKNSIYILKNGEWLLPGEGICMQLLERNFHNQLISPVEQSTPENNIVDC